MSGQQGMDPYSAMASDTSAARYETALKADNYVLMVHGTDADVSKAHEALFKANSWKQAA